MIWEAQPKESCDNDRSGPSSAQGNKEKAVAGTQTEKLFGNSLQIASASFRGFTRASVPQSEHDAMFGTLANEGQNLFEELAFRFALDLAKAAGHIADYVDLGDGNVFLVDEYVEIEVDYALTPAEIGRRASLGERDWEYVGTASVAAGKRKVKMAIGRLNRDWTEEQVTNLLIQPGCPLEGSGAWAREAFLVARPKYDGKGSIAFPDAVTSRWRYRRHGDVFFPYLWSDDDGRWRRSLDRVGNEWHASSRLCLLVRVAALGT